MRPTGAGEKQPGDFQLSPSLLPPSRTSLLQIRDSRGNSFSLVSCFIFSNCAPGQLVIGGGGRRASGRSWTLRPFLLLSSPARRACRPLAPKDGHASGEVEPSARRNQGVSVSASRPPLPEAMLDSCH